MRLLIAEDERDLAEALSVFFEKSQFTVDTVYNGFDAYEYAVTGDYDAIVLDVMMPKLNGVEVLERLRAEGVRTPVMMLTAKAEKDDRITGFNAGADDYLPKPLPGRTTICPSPLHPMSSSAACGPCCAAAVSTGRRCSHSATWDSTAARACSRARGRACA